MKRAQMRESEASQYGTACSAEMRKAGRNYRDSFTPCAGRRSLLKKIRLAAKNALSGDVILLSPACSSFDQFRENQGTEDVCPRAAKALAPTTCGGNSRNYHNRRDVAKRQQNGMSGGRKNLRLAPGFFEEKPRRKITTHNTPQERTLTSANH